ncbi:hypothetical protein AX761_23320 [Rhizobium sp. 58]|nr:hypothetical protein AX761_23320 [Rhizobium sp. 58]
MLFGGSYIKNADGSLTLVERTLEPDEAKAAAVALDGVSSSPEAEAGGTPASANSPETKPAGKSGKKDT